jgi:hypothetical protein
MRRAFLINTDRNNKSITLHPDFDGVSLLHYPGIKQVYYGTIKGKGSFIKFNEKRKACSYSDIYGMALREHIKTMVFNGRKDDSLMTKMGYKLLYQPSAASAVPDGDFYIYGKKITQIIFFINSKTVSRLILRIDISPIHCLF